MRKIERVSVSPADRERMERLVRDRNSPQKVVWRARIVLLASAGMTAEAIAAAVGKSLLTVRRWRRRYAAAGVDGLLKDATRPSRVKPLSAEVIERVVHMTLHEKPPNATHWSLRSMGKAAGLSYSSVQRIWRAHGLKPHQVETFKLSRDKNFAAKVQDVVGLYLNPPDKALVLCVDEKSQIQALDRTQPGLPMKKGRAGTMTQLQAQRHHHLVCCAQHARRQGHRCMPAASPAPRIPALPQADRSRDTRQSRPASHRRQLRHPQDPGGKALAQSASPLPLALHADLVIVAQHGRALLR
jgi:transposase